MRVYATAPTMTAKVTAKIGSARAVCCFSACASDAFPSAVKSFCELPENMISALCLTDRLPRMLKLVPGDSKKGCCDFRVYPRRAWFTGATSRASQVVEMEMMANVMAMAPQSASAAGE